jgi:hypothetical protein
MNKISIRFFDDKEVRAIWDDDGSKWWFSVIDIVGVLSHSSDSRNYWYVLKNRLKKAESEVLTNCKGFKLMSPDGKYRMTDCLTNDGVIALAKEFPGKKQIALSNGSPIAMKRLTERANQRPTLFLTVPYLKQSKWVLSKVCSSFMVTYSAGCMILLGKLEPSISQRGASNLPRFAF